MNKTISTMMLTAMLSMCVISAHADDNCDDPHNDFDGLYCLSKVYMQADKDLNVSYKALYKHLNGTQRATLKRGQLRWMRERDSRCSIDSEAVFFVNMDCAANTTIDRLNFLNDRLRECRAGSCRDSRLGD